MLAKLVVAAGAPGSGKTHLLNEMKALGQLDVVLEDNLNDFRRWPEKIPPLKRRLAQGERVGTCAQAFLQAEMRDTLKGLIGNLATIEWVFFEPDCPACLRNIIKDALCGPGKGRPYERTCRVVRIAEQGDIQIPPDTVLRPVFQQSITQNELSSFFQRVPKLRNCKGQERVTTILGM